MYDTALYVAVLTRNLGCTDWSIIVAWLVLYILTRRENL